MMNRTQLRIMIVEVLAALGSPLISESAVNLLMGTAAQESRLGEFWFQKGGGPALGIFQMEPETEKSIWEDLLRYSPILSKKVFSVTGVPFPGALRLKYDLRYQIVMARLKYFWSPDPLPEADDIPGLAVYWKRVYNTIGGAGKESEFITNYKELVV